MSAADKRAICEMMYAYERLKGLGWRDAKYCPKDETTFEVIEMGSTGIHDCVYVGEWPDGDFLIEGEPSHPVLYRAKQTTPPQPESRMVGGADV